MNAVDRFVEAYSRTGMTPKQGGGVLPTEGSESGCGLKAIRTAFPDYADTLTGSFRAGFITGFDGRGIVGKKSDEFYSGYEVGKEVWETVKDGVPSLV